jgi:ribosome-binding protein aMBF1 (putative translation factor)
MPRVKPSQFEERNRVARSVIAKYVELRAVSNNDLAKHLAVSVSTICKRRRSPETFTLWELRILCDYLKIPLEERALFLQ